MKMGISAEDVICRNGLELVIRTNGIPSCVKPETVDIMQERGMLINTKFSTSDSQIATDRCQDSNSTCIKYVHSKFLHYR